MNQSKSGIAQLLGILSGVVALVVPLLTWVAPFEPIGLSPLAPQHIAPAPPTVAQPPADASPLVVVQPTLAPSATPETTLPAVTASPTAVPQVTVQTPSTVETKQVAPSERQKPRLPHRRP